MDDNKNGTLIPLTEAEEEECTALQAEDLRGAVTDVLGVSEADLPELEKMAMQMSVLGEIFNGDWKEQENGLGILNDRMKDVDFKGLFGGMQLNPAVGGVDGLVYAITGQPGGFSYESEADDVNNILAALEMPEEN